MLKTVKYQCFCYVNTVIFAPKGRTYGKYRRFGFRLQDDNHAGRRKNHNPWGRCAKLRGFPDQGAIEFRIEKALQRSPQFGATGGWATYYWLVIYCQYMVNINDG